MEELINLFEKAKDTSKCVAKAGIYTGKEDFNALMDLLKSPLGIEFVTEHNFPGINGWLSFEKYDLESQGIYINKEVVDIENVKIVFLVGETYANLIFDNTKTNYNVILLHGARAIIKASNYAVVNVEGGTKDNLVVEVSDNAIVLN